MIRAIIVGAILAGAASPALAGDGCGGTCFVKVRTPPRAEIWAERALVQAPRTYALVTPARYETVTETVVVAPARRRWTTRRDAWGRTVGCWVETPARLATVSRRVMVAPPDLVPYATTAVYGARFSERVVEPAGTAWIPSGHSPAAGHGPIAGQGPAARYGAGLFDD